VAWACGIRSPWWHLWLVLYAAGLAGGALGLVVSATLRTTEAATAILPVLLMPMIVLGGVLVPLVDLPRVTQPLAAAMPSRWAFEGLVVPEAEARPRFRLPHPAAPHPESHAGPTRSRPPIVLAAGGQRRFILPGRQRIADALEEAAARAEREMAQAKADAERKAADMRREMERKVQESQAEFARKTAEMNAAIEGRIKEANASVEGKLNEIKDGMERERARMNETLERLGAAGERAVVPAAAPVAAGEVDMAERFFARRTWRAPAWMPLQVLAGMVALGIAATGLALRRRDLTGR
jgi:hypothetical protein